MTFLRTPALLIARIILGVIFISHGWKKFSNGLDATATAFDEKWSVPLPKLSAFFATWVEILGGAALILGVLLPLASALLAFTMFGAAWFAHWDGLFSSNSGYELVMGLAAGALAVGFANAGVVSIDHYLFRRNVTGRSTVVVDEVG